eukprot:Nk52_evm49s239 gene=Nk52_evmTU49s239
MNLDTPSSSSSGLHSPSGAYHGAGSSNTGGSSSRRHNRNNNNSSNSSFSNNNRSQQRQKGGSGAMGQGGGGGGGNLHGSSAYGGNSPTSEAGSTVSEDDRRGRVSPSMGSQRDRGVKGYSQMSHGGGYNTAVSSSGKGQGNQQQQSFSRTSSGRRSPQSNNNNYNNNTPLKSSTRFNSGEVLISLNKAWGEVMDRLQNPGISDNQKPEVYKNKSSVWNSKPSWSSSNGGFPNESFLNHLKKISRRSSNAE